MMLYKIENDVKAECWLKGLEVDKIRSDVSYEFVSSGQRRPGRVGFHRILPPHILRGISDFFRLESGRTSVLLHSRRVASQILPYSTLFSVLLLLVHKKLE